MMAIRAFYSGKAPMQIAALQVFLHDMRYDRAIKAIAALELLIITFLGLRKMLILACGVKINIIHSDMIIGSHKKNT